MKVLIVYAHHEPHSFCAALKDQAVAVLTEQGHQVQVSDLYAMKFKAVADWDDFTRPAGPDYLKYQAEQLAATPGNAFAPDILAEQERLLWADFVLLVFPLWWFSIPAILKGWVDRVFTMGLVYGGGKVYATGGLKGRRAMLAFATGGPAASYGPGGANGEINQLLYHVHHGMLWFAGMEVLPPFAAWSAARAGDEGRAQYLAAFRERLLTLETTEPIPF